MTIRATLPFRRGDKTCELRFFWPELGVHPTFLPGGRSSEDKSHHLLFPVQPGPCSFDRITDDDRAALRLLAKGAQTVIEVGTFLGASAEAMLGAMPDDGHLIAIDTFRGTEGNETAQCPRHIMLRYAVERLDPYEDRRTVIVGKSADAARYMADGIADLIFLDAAHDYANVKADIEAWLPKLKPWGVLAGHDYFKWTETMSDEEKLRRSALQHDPMTAIHWGVVRAVQESFRKVDLVGGIDSAVWSAVPAWRRDPDDISPTEFSHLPA